MSSAHAPAPALYHLALGPEWRAAVTGGSDYRRSTIGWSLDKEGFIHCSFAHQLRATADRFYRDRSDVVLLRLDPSRLHAPVRVEALHGDEAFPHVYGPIPLGAVVEATALALGADGRLALPALVGEQEPGDR